MLVESNDLSSIIGMEGWIERDECLHCCECSEFKDPYDIIGSDTGGEES